MLVKVISGGQVGADQGGLAAARDLGIETGGWAPKGWRTKHGPRPELAILGLKEHSSYYYPPRTYTNARDSDGTIRLAYDFSTAGELCTLKAIKQYDKPYRDIDLAEPDLCFDIADWILENEIKVLNVAGNAGQDRKEAAKIFALVRRYLTAVFKACSQTKGTETNDT